MAMAAGLMAVGTYLIYRRTKNRTEPRPIRPCQNKEPAISVPDPVSVHKRVVFASLVTGMYKRARKENSPARWWEEKHYELVPLEEILNEKELSDNAVQEYLKVEEEHKYFGVLRKKNSSTKAILSPLTAKWVVAIRGTIITRLRDARNDIRIALEVLHKSSAVKLLMLVLPRLIEIEKGDCSQLAITGHSLGASLGMLVARELALDGFYLDSHFFNPPYATLSALVEYSIKKFADFALNEDSATRLKHKVQNIQLGLSLGFNFIMDRGDTLQSERQKYEVLKGWTPHLYLHAGDPVCRLYILHFTKLSIEKDKFSEWCLKNMEKWHSPGSTISKALFGRAVTFHLMPTAICHIAKTHCGRRDSHRLHHWIKDDLPFDVKRHEESSGEVEDDSDDSREEFVEGEITFGEVYDDDHGIDEDTSDED